MTIKDSSVPMTLYFSIYLHLGSGLEPLAVYVYITMQKKLISAWYSLNVTPCVHKHIE